MEKVDPIDNIYKGVINISEFVSLQIQYFNPSSNFGTGQKS